MKSRDAVEIKRDVIEDDGATGREIAQPAAGSRLPIANA
jgi:hypothetical protein